MSDPADQRPDPEALLKSTDHERRGSLRIFLGASPGVGKTYAMLQAARERQRQGADVVIGVVESHGRKETEALCEGLEQLPPASLQYRDQTFREFDLDGALRRAPAVILVDELAHRNIPGARHPRRYQDIQELLEHGIDVWTAVNIQHLESLNDAVARITGIRMRETIPDALLEQAKDVILVDLPPDQLIERLRQGKVYVPEQARAAMDNFFTPPKLNALRELVLQTMTERIDTDVRTAMQSTGVAGPWPVRARILAAVDGRGSAESVVRSARRLAERRRAPWTVAHVETGRESPQAHLDVDRAFALAERLGGKTVTLRGYDVVAELVGYARRENMTTLIMGRGARPGWKHIIGRTLAGALVRKTQEFELTFIPVPSRRRAKSLNQPPPVVRHYLFATLAVTASVLISLGIENLLPLANLSLIFMTAVLLVASRTGTRPALFAAVLSFLAFNFFFTVPRLTFAMTDTSQILTVTFFLAMAIVGGQMAGRLRHQIGALRSTNDQTQRLLTLSKQMAAASTLDEVRQIGIDTTAQLLGVPAILIAVEGMEQRLVTVAKSDPSIDFEQRQWAAAEWTLQHGKPSGYQTDTLMNQDWHFLPLGEERDSQGVLALKLAALPQTLDPSTQIQIEALANQLTLALTRTRLSENLAEARVAEETERLRSALLSSISHDLRTPLASIIGSASTLRELEGKLNESDRHELLDSMLSEGERLNRYIQNLLDMTRLGHGTLKLERDWIGLADIVNAAIRRTRSLMGSIRIEKDLDPDIPLLYVHPALIEQALVNILENAARFSPPQGEIRIRARLREDQLELVISDQGPGIPKEQRQRVFDMFFTGGDGDRSAYGSGLGLAICHGMIGAHGGRIMAESGPGDKGTAIVIHLPLLAPPGEQEQAETETE